MVLASKSLRKASARHRMSAILETLEERQLFSLVGIGAELGLPATSILGAGAGAVTYNAGTHAFTITGAPVSMIVDATTTVAVSSPSGFTISLKVDNAGNATSGATPTTDVTMSGTVTIGSTTYTGTLLTGSIEAFGFQNGAGSGVDNFDFQFHVTGGQLAPTYFAGSDIGVVLADENSNFVDFTTNFSATPVKGYVGSVPPSGGNPPIVISGHKYVDQTGNGLSTDDYSHPLAGVTIQLYADSNGNNKLDSTDALAGTTTTDGTGAYSFTGMAVGEYFVKEVAPSGYIQTGPTSGTYTVNATSGTYGGLDFDNFKQDCTLTNICHISYTINGCKTVSSLGGNVHQGDTIKVTFTLSSPDTITLVSYTAPDPYFNANDASQQQIYSVATGTYTVPGTYSLTITVPQSYYQVDFVCGSAIDKLGPAGSNIFYHAQGRYIDSDNGGCTPPSATNSSIAGSVYVDCNNDGVRNSSEAGIANVTVTLTGTTTSGTAVSLTTKTDSSGNYKFAGLSAGTYSVTESTAAGYNDGIDSAGSLGGTVGNDVISNIVLPGNTYATNYNFGELKSAGVSGNSGRGNCKVTITGSDSWGRTCTYTTSTDSKGNYNFNNLCGGNYKVSEYDSHNNCTSSKSFSLDASKYQGQCVNLSTLCGGSSSLMSLIQALLAYFS